MQRWTRMLPCLRRVVFWASLSMGWTCAEELPEGQASWTSVAVDPRAVGLPDASDPTSTASTSTASAAATTSRLLPADNRRGLAVRWGANANRCLARRSATPQLNDPLVLANCSNSNAQAWTFFDGKLMADANLCVGAKNLNDVFSMVSCADPVVRTFVFNGGTAFLFQTNPILTMLPADLAGPVGSALQMVLYDDNPNILLGRWDLTGVGSQPGAPISFLSNPDACMTVRNNTLRVGTCDPDDSNQRWSMRTGDIGINNQCLVGTTPNIGITMIPCANVSNTATNNQGWYGYAFLRYASPYDTKYVQLTALDENQPVALTPAILPDLRIRYLWGASLRPRS